jgi:hypothetical protein
MTKGDPMRFARNLGYAVFLVMLGGGGAVAANICQTQQLTCATTMPVGGFCECTANGVTQDGSVGPVPPPGEHVNATAGGCGANPTAPGCH